MADSIAAHPPILSAIPEAKADTRPLRTVYFGIKGLNKIFYDEAMFEPDKSQLK